MPKRDGKNWKLSDEEKKNRDEALKDRDRWRKHELNLEPKTEKRKPIK